MSNPTPHTTTATGAHIAAGPPPTSDDTDENLASLLARREHARPNRATWALLTLVVLAVGFVGGAFAQSRWGSSSSTIGGVPDFAAMSGTLPGTQDASSPTGSSGPGGLPGRDGATFGTISSIDGNTLTITDASGKTVTVAVPSSAMVTANHEVSLAELAAGDTVIVRGETGDDGTVTATSVTEGTGGFPGGGPAGGQSGGSQPSGAQSSTSATTAPSAAAPQPVTPAPTSQGDAS